jgi:hypothetical protein
VTAQLCHELDRPLSEIIVTQPVPHLQCLFQQILKVRGKCELCSQVLDEFAQRVLELLIHEGVNVASSEPIPVREAQDHHRVDDTVLEYL